MGDTNNKASDPERRASVRTSRRVSLQHHDGPDTLDLDDEDYSLMALGVMVSDGFRPQPATTNNVSTQPEPAIRSPSPDLAEPSSSDSATPPRPHRSSISKQPRSSRDSFTLRHDGATGHMPGPSLSRVSSSSTDAAFIPVDGPYQGPSGPSHPYQMYSQNIRPTRTMSVATTSTTPATRPESEYSGPTGPSHPYSMYPQNPVEVPTSQTVVSAIPVGFATVPDMYQRRLGPEGEEVAAMIGPDGHTEELPPYTRYPDEFYARKIRANEVPGNAGSCDGSSPPSCAGVPHPVAGLAAAGTVAATSGEAAAPVLSSANIPPSIPGAGGIGLAARNPEFDARSVEDAASPQSRHSTRSFTSESHHNINTAAAEVSEKPKLSKWQQFMKRKACGVVPYWAIGLTGVAVLIVIIVVVTIIGTLLSHHGKKPGAPSSTKYQDSVPTVTVTFDATPIATPSNLPALAQGSFGLPLNLNQAPNTCFNDTSQTAAWTCNIIFSQLMSLELMITRNTPQLGKDGNYEVWLGANTTDGFDDPESGLSYGASVPSINPPMSMELVNDTFDTSRGPAWFRMTPYNKTVVVNEDLLSASSSSSKAKREPGGGVFNTVGNFQRKGVAEAGDRPWICTWPDTFVEVFIYATQNSSYASETGGGTITAQPSTTATATPTGTASTATATATDETISVQPLSAYPRAVKVKERRVNQSPRPYCVQVEVLSDNSTQPVLDSDGNQVTIEIVEIEQSNGMDKRELPRNLMFSRDTGGDMSDCGCMWFSS